jgi:hypothetical protein
MANQIDAALVIANRALLIPPNVGAAGVFERFPVIFKRLVAPGDFMVMLRVVENPG